MTSTPSDNLVGELDNLVYFVLAGVVALASYFVQDHPLTAQMLNMMMGACLIKVKSN